MNSSFQVLSRVVLLFVPLAVGEKRNVASVAQKRSKEEAVVFSSQQCTWKQVALIQHHSAGKQ